MSMFPKFKNWHNPEEGDAIMPFLEDVLKKMDAMATRMEAALAIVEKPKVELFRFSLTGAYDWDAFKQHTLSRVPDGLMIREIDDSGDCWKHCFIALPKNEVREAQLRFIELVTDVSARRFKRDNA